MDIRKELEFARGMVERRKDMVKNLGSAQSAREAQNNHRDIMGAVKEVNKHRSNILSLIDDTSAKYGLEVEKLLVMVEAWRERSAMELEKWGVSEQEVRILEEQVTGGSK